MSSKDNLQPLRDLAEKWEQLAKNQWMFSFRGAAEELTEALDRLEASPCDCTAGVDHVHVTGEDFGRIPKA